ncbi:MAG: AbrB/MazE/SpoVT family DNA-binding domain-containing protein [Archaeoglobaceae archaeon]
MDYGVKVKKVDKQGRILLPSNWRKEELKDSDEVLLIREKGVLKIIPKKRPDLTKYFDSVDMGVEAIEDWEEFEEKFHEVP